MRVSAWWCWQLVVAAIGAGLLSASGTVAAEPTPQLVDIRPDALATAGQEPIDDTPYWKVVGTERPPAASLSTFVSPDKAFDAGVSQYGRVTLELRDWPVDEFMYILEGQVEITATNGKPRLYGPGDAFVMPRGFSGTWRQLSAIRKIQVSYAGKPD